jgi:hypothetical protein
MRERLWMLCAAVAGLSGSGVLRAADDVAPLTLADDVPESIYAPIEAPREEEGINAGGVNFDLKVSYLTDYVYRGLDQSERLARFNPDGPAFGNDEVGSEDTPNLQFDASFELNLGKMPHPVAGVFVNVYNDDPTSRFQEIRPFIGLEWTLRPLTFGAGHLTYIFPEREDLNTSEVWASVTLDDSRLWRTERPVLSPYFYAAYDYELWDGVYLEAGVRHEIPLEDIGVTLTAIADVAYAVSNAQFQNPEARTPDDTGFQHYDLGLVGTYSLNKLLNIPRRYGQWHLNGYLYYTDGIEDGLRADSQMWGGAGIWFRY